MEVFPDKGLIEIHGYQEYGIAISDDKGLQVLT
jgi:hypothetical protein